MVTLGGCRAGRFMRALASSLMLHATFPLDVLAQTTPSSTAVPATPAVTAQPSEAPPPTALPSSAAIPPSVPPTTAMPAETRMAAADRRQVQEALHRLGYYQGPIDGIFGPLTRAAIRRFQHDIDAASTGYLSEEEANRLVRTPAAVTQPTTGQAFNTEQLDALVASIALYPDDLLTQLLMASTFPLEVVTAARWVEDPAHKSLSGDALAKALEAEPWDPSVKSLVPFPVVLATMNGNLTWLQQLGYAFATQQADVFAAVQRLRRLAQANDKLQSSPQQVVSTQHVTVEPAAGSSQPPAQQEVIVIQPAQSNTVYVPSYNPTTVYGSSWPYPSYPPYYAAPPPGYYFGTALATGLVFAAGVAVVGGLWGWASPGWGGGYANVNVNQYNNINTNRSQITSNRWGGGAGSGRAGNFARAPGGPAGLPGRSQVSVPGNAARPPTRPGGLGGVGVRVVVGRRGRCWRCGSTGRRGRRWRCGSAGRRRRGWWSLVARVVSGVPAGRPRRATVAQRPGGAFGDMNNSRRQTSQFGQRGAQSRSFGQQRAARRRRARVVGGARGGGGRGGGRR